MNKSDLTDDHIEFWRHAHAHFSRSYSSIPTVEEAKSGAEWSLDARFSMGMSYSSFARDRRLQFDWAMQILVALSDGHIPEVSPTYENLETWDVVEVRVRAHVQEAYVEQLIESRADEEWQNPWEGDYITKPVMWFLKNMSPFHIWTVYTRVEESAIEAVRESLLSMSVGGEENITRPTEEAFTQAVRGVDEWIEKMEAPGEKIAKGVSLSSSTP